MLKLLFAFILCAFLLAACQNTALYLANISNSKKYGATEIDVPYGQEKWQKLDIYYPENPQDTYPTLVFYYGGSWVKGSKEQYEFIANRFAREGSVVVIPDYVKYPEATYPAFVEDAALVSAWLKNHAAEKKLNLSHLILVGHSAGAHIGMMLLADKQYLAKYNLQPNFYRAFIGLAGPYDFTPESDRYREIFGPEEKYSLMQAAHFIDGSEPPMLLMIGGVDWLVNRSNTDKVAAAIKKAGGEVKTKNYAALGHLTILGGISDTLPVGGEVTEDIIHFIKRESPKQADDQRS